MNTAPRSRRLLRVAAGLAVLHLSGCTAFGPVRSADVRQGWSAAGRATVTASLGDDAAWFWAWDCASNCDRAMAGYELEVWYGKEGDEGSLPYELGAGVAGLAFPFVQGYLQLRDGDRPLGIGARIGVPMMGGHEHQLVLRYDVPLSGGGRILIDPAVFLHSVNSPNGENGGLFLGLVPAVGLEIPLGSVAFIPSVAVVGGWVRRESYGLTTSSFALFPTLSLGIAPGQGPP